MRPQAPVRPHHWVYLTTSSAHLGAQTPASRQVCTHQFCNRGRHSTLFREYSGLPLGPAFEQTWAPCCGEKRGYEKKRRKELEDNGL